jgi:hypothetical protein
MARINDWASHQGSVDGKECLVVQQGFDLFWNNTPLQSVQRCDMLPCSGKELRTLQERCSQGTSTLCWLSGIVF